MTLSEHSLRIKVFWLTQLLFIHDVAIFLFNLMILPFRLWSPHFNTIAEEYIIVFAFFIKRISFVTLFDFLVLILFLKILFLPNNYEPQFSMIHFHLAALIFVTLILICIIDHNLLIETNVIYIEDSDLYLLHLHLGLYMCVILFLILVLFISPTFYFFAFDLFVGAYDYLQQCRLDINIIFQQILKNIKYQQRYWETRQILSESILGEGELPRLISEIANS